MARVQGVREKVHLPIYDCVRVEPEKQLREAEPSSTLKFFVNVQNKTKLETNLQSASLLPHYNTFEARAMRVVISDLPPEYPDDRKAKGEEYDVTTSEDKPKRIDETGKKEGDAGYDATKLMFADLELDLKFLMEKLKESQEEGEVEIGVDEDGVTLTKKDGDEVTPAARQAAINLGAVITLSTADLEEIVEDLGKQAPPQEQLRPTDGAGTLIGKLIYNTVTTFYVGEKVMIQMPTWFFPAGAGPYADAIRFTTHGEPSPLATFRFAEPIFIDKQQNFRVEIEVPDSDTLKEIQKIYGPLAIWVVLDGYMTRDVQ